MHAEVTKSALAVAGLLVLAACAGGDTDVAPSLSGTSTPSNYLASAHSHNNYDQPRPLVDAVERGFASIEVDVILIDGELFVAHDLETVDPSVTLTSLYLDPLRDIVRRNGGSVYGPTDPPLQLLIDVKTEAEATYQVLYRRLAAYSDLFTTWTTEGPRPGPVTAVLSGNRAVERVLTASPRYVAIDGRTSEDRSTLDVGSMPLVSIDWEELGPPVPGRRLEAARTVVALLHGEGRKVRFWGTPEREDLWRSLLAMGVDYIGTDEVNRLDRLLREVGDAAAAQID